jgi:3D (Asp-Asp-Asp) domain-containing protein
LRKATVKGFGGVFLNHGTGLAIVLLAAIAYALSCIDVIGYAATGRQTTLLSTSIPETGTVSEGVLNKSGREVEAERHGPNTANNPAANSELSGEWQSVQMRVTAYCPCPKCCGIYSDGETACGHKILPGDALVAADKKYPFGTEMVISGYNGGEPVKVLDRGGAIYENRLDVLFLSHEEALEWGVKYIDIKIRRE